MNDQTFECEMMHLANERHTAQNEMFYSAELGKIEHMNCTLKETTHHQELEEENIDAENSKWTHQSNAHQQHHFNQEVTDEIDQKTMTMKTADLMLLSLVVLTFWSHDTSSFLYSVWMQKIKESQWLQSHSVQC